ncbi:MAG: NUDIX domain-containing protein [Deltaproteobacteria bacterium]|jgi:bis(5'-nucleosidyl)-tetraphosphatase|nr:NUDIX domain-containing protein [Deltaproteobacteria bacterium]
MKDKENKPYRTLSAGVVIVRQEDGQWHYLLLRAYSYWDFPKGMVEQGEEPIKAAMREVREETGITDLQFRWGYDYRDTPPYNKGKIARYYLAETHTKEVQLLINPAIGRAEHEEYRWLSYDEAIKLLAPRVRHVIDWAKDLLGATRA